MKIGERQGRKHQGRDRKRGPSPLKPDMAAQAEHTLPPKFWARFVKRYWERRPLVIKQPFTTQFINSEEAFAALVESSEEYRAGGNGNLNVYVEYALLIAEVWKHLPVSDDGSIAGYAERVTQQFRGQRFGLVAGDFQVHSVQLWLRLRAFLGGLYEVIGIPSAQTNSAVFLGTYEKTPLGLHEADASNFIFVIEGRKRLRVWPSKTLRRQGVLNHSLDYGSFIDDSIALEGEPGDVIYWPSNYWHIGESVDGGLAVSLSVAIFMNPHLPVDLSPAAEMVEERLMAYRGANTYPLNPHRLRATVRKLPRMSDRLADALNKASQNSHVHQTLQVNWMNCLTGFGFASVPPPLPRRALDHDEIVRGDPNHPIMWLATGDNEIICSANGHSFSISAHPKIPRLLDCLNGGSPHRVKHLSKEYAGTAKLGKTKIEASPDDIRVILEKLYSLRAITLVQPAASLLKRSFDFK
jgi:50S ribosomal protein L16 3-hydroxylase